MRTKAQDVVVVVNGKRKGLRKGRRAVRQYRRKQGVNRGNFGCLHAKNLQNTLDRM